MGRDALIEALISCSYAYWDGYYLTEYEGEGSAIHDVKEQMKKVLDEHDKACYNTLTNQG